MAWRKGTSFEQHRQHVRMARVDRVAAFADALADNLTVTQAAARIGVTYESGRKYLREMERKFGWQAR